MECSSYLSGSGLVGEGEFDQMKQVAILSLYLAVKFLRLFVDKTRLKDIEHLRPQKAKLLNYYSITNYFKLQRMFGLLCILFHM